MNKINLIYLTNQAIDTFPREWFVVPLNVIDEVIQLLLNGNIIHHKYNVVSKRVELK